MRGIGLDDTLGLTALSSEAHRQGMMIGYENAFLLYAYRMLRDAAAAAAGACPARLMDRAADSISVDITAAR